MTPDHICVPGFEGALVILKIPPVKRGSIFISCFSNESSWWGFIPPAIIISLRGSFRIISISYFVPVKTLSGILKVISILLLSFLIVVNKFFKVPVFILFSWIENKKLKFDSSRNISFPITFLPVTLTCNTVSYTHLRAHET